MNGLLILDKPAGMTSHDVVAIVRRVTGERSVGHLGTLDPMATGVLPLLLGKYTRLAQFFGQADKSYTGEIRFGFATDTFDAEGTAAGEVVALGKSLEELRELAGRFHGAMDQMPPVFSAKKINGVPAHKLARAGKDVPVKAARITIHCFELTGLVGEVAGFEMKVSAGGYDAEGTAAGEVVALGKSLEELRELAGRFHGAMDQMPPVFSAKKINGVPAHKLARAGKDVPVKAARITIHCFELTGLVGEVAGFEMKVSAGGYVRSVAHELGGMAGCGAHLSSLRRTEAGAFTLAQAVRLDELKGMTVEDVEARLPHPRTLLPEMPSVGVDEQTAGRIRNGMQVNVPEFSAAPLVKVFAGQRELLCVAKRIAGTLVQPVVVLA